MNAKLNHTLLLLILLTTHHLRAQQAEYIFVVTTDGLRWQEVFKGADSLVIRRNVDTPDLYLEKYYSPIPEIKRALLMPFFWNTLAKNGQIYGNREKDNFVNNTNSTSISYPGYSEMMTGYCDNKRIKRNAKMMNPNTNVLEWLSRTHQTAAFCSWNVFPYILNEPRSGFSVNAGFEPISEWGSVSLQDSLNALQKHSVRPWKKSVRPDTLTWTIAQQYIQLQQPEITYLAFGETDEYAHEGSYAGYLDAAHQFDEILSQLWSTIQRSEKYAEKTALVITTDHGRGENMWRHHHDLIKGSSEIWLAVAGPGIAPTGEIKTPMQIYQTQTAQTIAHLLNEHFESEHLVAAPIYQILESAQPDLLVPAIAAPILNLSTSTGMKK